METDGINALNPAPDVGGILPPRIDAPGPLASYFTRPMVPSPASRRRDALKGIAQFIPFLSGEIAKYDDDKLGIALSSLDALGPAGTTLKSVAVIGKQAAKKGVGSLDQPKDMMFVHNTSEDAIKSFDQMGGIPSPSLAIQPADVPLKGFGDIQLIAKPKNFDPSVDPRNAVYSADAYTPRAPKKIRLAKEGAGEQLKKDYTKYYEKYFPDVETPNIGTPPYLMRESIEKIADDLNNLQKNNVNRPQDRIENFDNFFYTDIARLKFAKETGEKLGEGNLVRDIRKFKKWIAKEKDKYLSQDGVFVAGRIDKDTGEFIDPFDTTIKPYTLENATRNMIEETQRGGEAASTLQMYGPARLRALMSEKMTDLPDIKNQRSRIQNNPYPASLNDDIEELLENAVDEAPNMQDAMNLSVLRDEGDNLTNQIGMYLDEGDTIEEAVTSAINYFNVYPTPGLTDDIVNIFKKNAERNVEYLEAKPMRAVGFDEFAGAIVPPKTSQEVIDILENRGLKVIKNDPETDFMKTKARQKFKDQMFSFAPIAGAGGIAALSIDDNTPDENKGVGSLN
jgi:hypothetical protein